MRFQDEHIANVSIGRIVRDHTGKPHLSPIAIHSKTKRILDGAGHDFTRNSFGPIAFCQETVDEIQIQSFVIRTDDEFAFAVFCSLWLASFHFAVILT